jgi:pheromone shutdown protein TraB
LLCILLLHVQISEEDIKALGEADMVELLLTEFAQEYPEVMPPLLHDRWAARATCCGEAMSENTTCLSLCLRTLH